MALEQARLATGADPDAGTEGPAPLYTIGHSTRELDELVRLLRLHRVAHLFDVRRWPTSQRHPQFKRETLAAELPERGIAYTHLEAMGGYRSPSDESRNGAWRSEGFQGYADHMHESRDWEQAFERVLATADELAEQGEGYACVMCAEIVPYRCHRRLISDMALARGRRVVHVIEEGQVAEHELPDWAEVEPAREGDGEGDKARVVYPASD